MAFGSLQTYSCRALQQAYVDYYGANAAVNKTMGSTALIKWLLSPQNTRGFKEINPNSDIPGKTRPIAFRYDLPFCFDLATPTVDCTTTRTVRTNPSQEIVFDLTGNAFRPYATSGSPEVLQFTRDSLRKYCTQTDQSYMTDQIFRYIHRANEALDKALFTILNANVGTNSTGGATTTLPFFAASTNTGTNALNPDSLWWMDQEYLNIGGEGQYALIGGQVLNRIMAFKKWAGLNAAGTDLSLIGDLDPYTYYDRNADTVIGKADFLQISPGAVQLVTYNDYVGEYNKQVTDLYERGTVVDPNTGLRWDYEWDYDYKCQVYTFGIFLHVELAIVQPGGCPVTSGIATSNGIIKYIDCTSSVLQPVCPS